MTPTRRRLTHSPARNRGTRARLSRHRVLEAALALVDREGATALSMRRLGQELGVEAMSLYSYVAGREELLDGLSEVMVEALPRRGTNTDWRASVHGFAHGIRNTARRHPQAFLLVGMRPLKTVKALVPIDTVLSALMAAGFTPPEAVSAYRLVAAYARGFALAEIEGFTLETNLSSPPSTPLPSVEAARATAAALDHERGFASGLETIIAGLAQRCRASRRNGQPTIDARSHRAAISDATRCGVPTVPEAGRSPRLR